MAAREPPPPPAIARRRRRITRSCSTWRRKPTPNARSCSRRRSFWAGVDGVVRSRPRVSLLHEAPRLDLDGAARLARELYGLDASPSILPSERDQNFLLTTAGGDRCVLKVSNRTEQRAMLDAQNGAMRHVARRVTCCQRVLPTVDGELIGITPERGHLVRLVTYLG